MPHDANDLTLIKTISLMQGRGEGKEGGKERAGGWLVD